MPLYRSGNIIVSTETKTLLIPKCFVPSSIQHRVVSMAGHDVCIFPHTVPVVHKLAASGLSAPSPIYTQYDWPGLFAPYDAQKKTAAFLTEHSRAYCLSQMGVGKTMASLWAADFLMCEGVIQQALIVSPLSTLRTVWANEIETHLPHRTSVVLHGTKAKRLALLRTPADFYIINHDGVRVLQAELAQMNALNLVIIDELSEYRTAYKQRWRALHSLTSKPTTFVWGLTGTPTPNSPTDVFGQAKLVTPHTVPKSFGRFRDDTMMRVSPFIWVERSNATETAHRALQPAIRFERSDCVDLPPIVRTTRICALTPEQEKLLKELTHKFHAEYDGSAISAANEAVVLSKMLQVISGDVYATDGVAVSIPTAPRLAVLHELIREAEGKVIIFAPFISTVKALVNELKTVYSVRMVVGDTSDEERHEIFTTFQQETDPQILIAHPRTVSHGLTLTAATMILWYAPITSNNIYEQACARISRSGQTKTQIVAHIEATALEHKMYKRLEQKQKMQGLLLEMFGGQQAQTT